MLLSLHTTLEPFDSTSPFVKDAAIVAAEGDIKEEDSDMEDPLKSLDVNTPMGFRKKNLLRSSKKELLIFTCCFQQKKTVSHRFLIAI
jgi:hypothetical protein